MSTCIVCYTLGRTEWVHVLCVIHLVEQNEYIYCVLYTWLNRMSTCIVCYTLGWTEWVHVLCVMHSVEQNEYMYCVLYTWSNRMSTYARHTHSFVCVRYIFSSENQTVIHTKSTHVCTHCECLLYIWCTYTYLFYIWCTCISTYPLSGTQEPEFDFSYKHNIVRV